jgi:hypothetical protein
MVALGVTIGIDRELGSFCLVSPLPCLPLPLSPLLLVLMPSFIFCSGASVACNIGIPLYTKALAWTAPGVEVFVYAYFGSKYKNKNKKVV